MWMNILAGAMVPLFLITGVVNWRKGEKINTVIDFSFAAVLTGLLIWMTVAA